jgi:type IV pilus assembly protein PilC
MPNFSYKGRKRGGEHVSGTRTAESASALAIALRADDIMLVEAKEKRGLNIDFGGNPTPKDLAVFTRQFSVMIDAGLPLVQCLDILGA